MKPLKIPNWIPENVFTLNRCETCKFRKEGNILLNQVIVSYEKFREQQENKTLLNYDLKERFLGFLTNKDIIIANMVSVCRVCDKIPVGMKLKKEEVNGDEMFSSR